MTTIKKASEKFVAFNGAALRLSYERRHDIAALLIGCPIAGFVLAAFFYLMVRQ